MWPICLVLGLCLISSQCFAANLIEPNDSDEEHLSVARNISENTRYTSFNGSSFMHSDNTSLFWCMKIGNGADESCEPYCTNEPLCLGYATMAQYGICLLYPKKPTDGSDYICSTGFISRTGTYPETPTDLVPIANANTAGYTAYRKILAPTCNDGIQNQNETGIDCGGICPLCPTCNDGILNQNETGIDCGGICPACQEPTTTTTTTPEPTPEPSNPEPTNPEPTEPPKTEKCWNLRPKRQCRRILMKGFCAKKFWARSCCRTCGGCGNIWSRKRCSKLTPFCRRSNKIRKKCKKSCKQC